MVIEWTYGAMEQFQSYMGKGFWITWSSAGVVAPVVAPTGFEAKLFTHDVPTLRAGPSRTLRAHRDP